MLSKSLKRKKKEIRKDSNKQTSVDQFSIFPNKFDKQIAITGLVDESFPSSTLISIRFNLIINFQKKIKDLKIKNEIKQTCCFRF